MVETEGIQYMATDAKLACNQRYLDKLDRITIRLRKDGSDGITKEDVELAAKSHGMSINQWIIDLIRDAIM